MKPGQECTLCKESAVFYYKDIESNQWIYLCKQHEDEYQKQEED